MSGNVLFFQWHVHSCGYRWLKVSSGGTHHWEAPPIDYFGSKEEKKYLSREYKGRLSPGYFIATSDDVSRCSIKSVKPMDESPALFLSFAQNQLTADRLLGFANRWGFLTTRADAKTWQVPSPINGDQQISIFAEHTFGKY